MEPEFLFQLVGTEKWSNPEGIPFVPENFLLIQAFHFHLTTEREILAIWKSANIPALNGAKSDVTEKSANVRLPERASETLLKSTNRV